MDEANQLYCLDKLKTHFKEHKHGDCTTNPCSNVHGEYVTVKTFGYDRDLSQWTIRIVNTMKVETIYNNHFHKNTHHVILLHNKGQ